MIAALESPAAAPANQQPKDLIAELQKTVSASRLGLWHSCRLKFWFRYVKQIKKAPTPSMHAGSSVHSVLQAWIMSRWRREPFATERFKALFNVRWLALQAESKINWDGEEDADRSSAWNALAHYFQETPIRADEKPQGVEVAVSADLSKHGLPTLVGILDLVRSGGRIVDFTPGRLHAVGGQSGRPHSRWRRKLGTLDQLVDWFKPATRPTWLAPDAWAVLPATLTVTDGSRSHCTPSNKQRRTSR